MNLLPPSLAGRYEAVGALGAGGFGAVVAAFDRELRRKVAIKVLHRPDQGEMLARFERECRTLAGLQSPHVVRLYDFGVAPEGPWMAMELLEGTPLDRQDCPALPREAVLQLAAGLEAVHRAGLVHRDVKPGNALWTRDGRAVLIDFGLVLDPTRTALTATGKALGTLPFMAPELLRGDPATPAADWYALGATLFMLHEGIPPYRPEELIATLGGQPLPALRLSRLKEGTAELRMVRACLDPEPRARPASVAALLALEDPGRDRGEDLRKTEVVLPPPGGASGTGRSSLAVPALSSGAPEMPAPPRPGSLPPRLGQGLAALTLAAFLGSIWQVYRKPAGDPVAPSAPVAAAPGLPADLAARLEDDARALSEESRDPARLGAQLDGLSGVTAPLGQLEAGVRPEDFPQPVRAALVGFDAALQAGHRPRLFFPHFAPADGSPGEARGGFDIYFAESIELERLPFPARPGPWLVTALDSLGRARARIDGLAAPFEHPGASREGLPPAVAAALVGPVAPRWHDMVARLYGNTESRRELCDWLAPAAEERERGLVAGMRSITEESATAEWAALAMLAALGQTKSLEFGPRSSLSPLFRIGGPPANPPAALVLAEVCRQARLVLGPTGRDDPRLAGLEAEALDLALRPAPEPGPEARIRRGLALERRIHGCLLASKPKAGQELFLAHRELAEDLDPRRRLIATQRLAECWLALPEPERTPRPVRDPILAWARNHLDSANTRNTRENWVSMLAALSPAP